MKIDKKFYHFWMLLGYKECMRSFIVGVTNSHITNINFYDLIGPVNTYNKFYKEDKETQEAQKVLAKFFYDFAKLLDPEVDHYG